MWLKSNRCFRVFKAAHSSILTSGVQVYRWSMMVPFYAATMNFGISQKCHLFETHRHLTTPVVQAMTICTARYKHLTGLVASQKSPDQRLELLSIQTVQEHQEPPFPNPNTSKRMLKHLKFSETLHNSKGLKQSDAFCADRSSLCEMRSLSSFGLLGLNLKHCRLASICILW